MVGPLLWLRYEAAGRTDRKLGLAILLALVWMVVGALVLLGVAALVVRD